MNYQERRALGLCGICSTNRPERDTTRCTRCRERQNASKRALRARLKAQGICTRCRQNPSAGDTTRCIECKVARRKSSDKAPTLTMSADKIRPLLPDTQREFVDCMVARFGGKEDTYRRHYTRLKRNKYITVEVADKILIALDRHLWEAS